ncbi:peptidoglycan recognition family protein [Streptomyces sp. NPDC003038]|uniref:peptidoglycan recognition protein family protein n=1 Tax=unclassified Streptomyces TaxID=2593676 RepID=UPI0033AE1A68
MRSGLALTAGVVLLPSRTVRPAFAAAGDAGLRIHERVSWGAVEPLHPVRCAGELPKKIIIHHTATANVQDLSLSRAYALSRAIQRYHQQTMGWIDTGQHFTVSRGGHLLEGREHSLRELRRGENLIIGSHCTDQNTVAIGIEIEGNYSKSAPSQIQYGALVEMCTYICSQYGMSPSEIYGHRDFNATACPGTALYETLPDLRTAVAQASANTCGEWQSIGTGPTEFEEPAQSLWLFH